MTIKAIETYYHGHHFRSRLEARWAVFFDSIGIQYRYEPEGFDLGDGIWYLPDFEIGQGTYIEIKPRYPSPEECEKAIRLSIGKQCMVMIFAGNIWPDEYDIIVFSPADPNIDQRAQLRNVEEQGGLVHWRSRNQALVAMDESLIKICTSAICLKRDYIAFHTLLLQCLRCGKIFFQWASIHCECHEPKLDFWKVDDMTPFLMMAYVTARQARFERKRR